MFIFDEFSPEPNFPKYNKSEDNFDEEIDEAIQEIVESKPIYDDDSLQEDQLADIFFFHEDDRALMFDNLEEFFLFKNDLDYEFEEYETKRDKMPEIESEFLVLKEFSANTQIAKGYTSLCLPIDQKPSVL